jgi:hypothetical protein
MTTSTNRGLAEALREMHAYAREAVQAAGCGFSGWEAAEKRALQALATPQEEAGSGEALPTNASRQTRIAIAKALGLPFTSVNDRRIHRAYGALIAPATLPERESVAVEMLRDYADALDAEGSENGFFEPSDLSISIRLILSLLEKSHVG